MKKIIKKLQSVMLVCMAISGTLSADKNTTKIVKKVSGSVVLIKTYSDQHGNYQGSGVLIGDGKTIVTNLHVIENANKVFVEFSNGKVIRSSGYLGVNAKKDLVTIRLPKKITTTDPVKITKLDQVQIGEKVVAIGNPKGLTNTVSEGIISAIREVNKTTTIIQTTAPVSSGSSGGGLFNEHAELIGITSFGHVSGQNLNFAYPADEIFPLLKKSSVIPFYQLKRSNMKMKETQSVFVTKSGKKYHKYNCRHLRKSRIKISIVRADRKGYSACGNCFR